jgi:hypothetical protein
MTTDTNPGTDPSTGTADAGTGEAAKTLLDTTGADAGTTADTSTTGDAGKAANVAVADDKTVDKTDDPDKSKEGEKSDDDKKTADGPPEKYEFELPDGMELDTALAEKADPIFRELNLTNEQAGKLAKLVAEQRISEGQAQQDAYAKQMQDWADETQADKEIGGTALESNVKFAHQFIGQYGSPELKALLRDTGLGNHPELVRVFVRAGKAMAEDGGVSGKSTGATKSAAAVLFDNPTSNHTR